MLNPLLKGTIMKFFKTTLNDTLSENLPGGSFLIIDDKDTIIVNEEMKDIATQENWNHEPFEEIQLSV